MVAAGGKYDGKGKYCGELRGAVVNYKQHKALL